MRDFIEFPKIGRLSRDMIVTEKLDGTNACVWIELDTDEPPQLLPPIVARVEREEWPFMIAAGSRTRWITPEDDNHGFAKWVRENAAELVKLGAGQHFGEWWGAGIQRGYGLKEKRFSLFNVRRWGDALVRPVCCGVVPTLYTGDFDTKAVLAVMSALAEHGSRAAPGFMKPEGVVIFHTQSGALFKKTFEKDDAGKGREPPAAMSGAGP